MTSPADISLIKTNEKNSVFRVIIHEGRNRQVRRMFEAIGHRVVSLKRIAIGSLELGSLPPGKWRYLTGNEVRELFEIIKL